jgi:hypothetical protein
MYAKDQASSHKVVLSFFADSALWDNLVYVLAYPSGMSYFRPFRYRAKWVDDGIQKELKGCGSRRKFVGRDAILAVRFCSEKNASSVLPIRAAKITNIDFIPDNITIYFQLGQFYLPDVGTSLSKQCLEFTEEAEGAPKDKLFFQCKPALLPPLCSVGDPEDEAWIGWVNAICADKTLPFHDNARRSVFIRVSRLRAKQCLPVKQIHRSWQMGPVYGFVGKEGKAYELIYFHRVPFLFETNESVSKFRIKHTPYIELGIFKP